MADYRSILLAVAVVLGFGLVAAVILVLASKREHPSPDPDSPGERLAVLMRQRSDYNVLVGVPPDRPDHWASASGLTTDAVTVEGHGNIPLVEVRAFVVSYPGGQLVDCEPVGLPVPAGFTGLVRGQRSDHDVLQPADLKEGRNYIEVKYGRSALKPNDASHYSTTLTNISGKRIKVLRFAGYALTPGGWKLHTVTGGFYSAQEFREWYGLGPKEWIGPGESATDPNNYGSPPVLWAYYCRTEDGQEFVAGGVLE
jgi:hypothetical protein